MRLVEIRLLEGPNVYRLVPVVKVEVAVGRRADLAGVADATTDVIVHLGRSVPARDWPDQVADLVAWTRRLRADHDEHGGPVEVHRAVGHGTVGRHVAVGRRGAGAPDRRGRVRPRRRAASRPPAGPG